MYKYSAVNGIKILIFFEKVENFCFRLFFFKNLSTFYQYCINNLSTSYPHFIHNIKNFDFFHQKTALFPKKTLYFPLSPES